ncbi:MAG: CoA transferase [Saprospiraceae bacterium]|nr:CoA transferase [Saprospiraceae bacterium]
MPGPLVASFFAELGAEVIKVENKLTGGDATRQWKLPTEKKDAAFSAYYHSANYGKKVLMRDMTDANDRADVEKSCRKVISSYPIFKRKQLKNYRLYLMRSSKNIQESFLPN